MGHCIMELTLYHVLKLWFADVHRFHDVFWQARISVRPKTLAIARVLTLLINKFSCICEGQSWWVRMIINGVHGPEPRSSGGNTSSNPQVSALIPRPAFDGMERMFQRHGSNYISHPPVLVRKPLCNQFIHYHISSRSINHFKLRKFAVVGIEWFFCNHW